jgi:hypothetical protein
VQLGMGMHWRSQHQGGTLGGRVSSRGGVLLHLVYLVASSVRLPTLTETFSESVYLPAPQAANLYLHSQCTFQ